MWIEGNNSMFTVHHKVKKINSYYYKCTCGLHSLHCEVAVKMMPNVDSSIIILAAIQCGVISLPFSIIGLHVAPAEALEQKGFLQESDSSPRAMAFQM